MSILERRVQQLTPMYRASYPDGLSAWGTLIWVEDHAPEMNAANVRAAAAMLLGMTEEEFEAAVDKEVLPKHKGSTYDTTMDVLKLLGVLLLAVTVVYWGVELLYKVLV